MAQVGKATVAFEADTSQVTGELSSSMGTALKEVSKAVEKVKSAGYLADGNVAVITAGMPAGVSGTTNMIKAHVVGEQN